MKSAAVKRRDLAGDTARAKVPRGSVRIWWLGQAGFAFKSAAGKVFYLDPYLSDACERLAGLKRLSLPPIAAEDVRLDAVILTHEHGDHLDVDALPVIARQNPDCLFVAPAGCAPGLAEAGIRKARHVRIEPGRPRSVLGIRIHAVRADHGAYSPTAVGLLLDFGGTRVLVSGDTSLRPDLFQPLYDRKPDVVIPCINGTYGNMTHIDAAVMVQQAKPRYAIPGHFWMFAGQCVGEPGAFQQACRTLCPGVEALVLTPGEGFTCRPRR